MQQRRAIEVWEAAIEVKTSPVSEAVFAMLTPEERDDVGAIWDTMANEMTWMDAFYSILQGRKEAQE